MDSLRAVIFNGNNVIRRNVEEFFSPFPGTKQASDSAGWEWAEKEVRQRNLAPRSLSPVCAASIQYAAAVESKGRDVLTGFALVATADLKKAIKKLTGKIE